MFFCKLLLVSFTQPSSSSLYINNLKFSAITGGYKTINKPGSTELGIEDNDNTDPMVTDQQRMFQFFFGISFTFCIV